MAAMRFVLEANKLEPRASMHTWNGAFLHTELLLDLRRSLNSQSEDQHN